MECRLGGRGAHWLKAGVENFSEGLMCLSIESLHSILRHINPSENSTHRVKCHKKSQWY